MMKPLIQMRPYQEAPFWAPYRQLMKLWRRQSGKTYGEAAKSIKINMEKAWNDVVYASASLKIGGELITKEVRVWSDAMDKLRLAVEAAKLRLETTFDGLDLDACCDIFEHGKYQVKIWHSSTSYSRTIIIAPNVATARSWTGTVIVDEVDFIRDFDELYEAVEPIMSSDKSFRLHMATTLGPDDNSWVYRNCFPPEGFDPSVVNPKGKWYTSTMGIRVHMLNAADAHAAGLKMFDANSGEELSPEKHRAAALDRDAWDRNYGLLFKSGGTSALGRQSILASHVLCRTLFPCVAVEDVEPVEIEKALPQFTQSPEVGISIDLATTTNARSNPSSITIGERVGRHIVPRLVGRFHSADPQRTRDVIKAAISACPSRPKFIVIDATNERFFAIDLKREIMRDYSIPIYLYIASETVEVTPNQKVTKKTYSGNLLVNAVEDGTMPLPAARWLEDDLRSVRREKGLFENQLDAAGNHGDCFDSLKMLVFGFVRGFGPVEIEAAGCGAPGDADDDEPPEIKAMRRQSHFGDYL
jgi:hypothetical protein